MSSDITSKESRESKDQRASTLFTSTYVPKLINTRESVVTIILNDPNLQQFIGCFIKNYLILTVYSLFHKHKNCRVLIENINISKKTIVADAEMICYDEYLDIAIVRLRDNIMQPNHPYLHFGKSPNLNIGDTVYGIDSMSINTCMIANKNIHTTSMEHFGISKDIPISSIIINTDYKLVGIYHKQNMVLTERSMRNSLMTMKDYLLHNTKSDSISIVDDIACIHTMYYGLTCKVYNSSDIPWDIEYDKFYCEIIGYVICDKLSKEDSENSLANLPKNALITHINEEPLGIYKGQKPPYLVLSKLMKEPKFNVTYRLREENYLISRTFIETNKPRYEITSDTSEYII